jgi:hypothetical protein
MLRMIRSIVPGVAVGFSDAASNDKGVADCADAAPAAKMTAEKMSPIAAAVRIICRCLASQRSRPFTLPLPLFIVRAKPLEFDDSGGETIGSLAIFARFSYPAELNVLTQNSAAPQAPPLILRYCGQGSGLKVS